MIIVITVQGLVPDLFNPNERSGLHRFGCLPLMGCAANQVTMVTVFQDDNKATDILWKKMRDDGCAPLDRSLSSGSLAGQNSPPSKCRLEISPRKGSVTTSRVSTSDAVMGRMMPGNVSSYLNSLQQHRKSQYAGNTIGGAPEERFPQKSCNYPPYNLLPSNKTEGEPA